MFIQQSTDNGATNKIRGVMPMALSILLFITMTIAIILTGIRIAMGLKAIGR